jgi:hypothetical protein
VRYGNEEDPINSQAARVAVKRKDRKEQVMCRSSHRSFKEPLDGEMEGGERGLLRVVLPGKKWYKLLNDNEGGRPLLTNSLTIPRMHEVLPSLSKTIILQRLF